MRVRDACSHLGRHLVLPLGVLDALRKGLGSAICLFPGALHGLLCGLCGTGALYQIKSSM